MSLDVAALRAATPGCTEVVHLNNAGAALPTRAVVDRVIEHLELEAVRGGYEAQDLVAGELADIYTSVGELVGAPARDIALVGSATEAWERAFLSVPLGKGDRVLIDRTTYGSCALSLLHRQRRDGFTLEVVDEHPEGGFDPADLARRVEQAPALVCLTHIPTSGGLVSPVEAARPLLEGKDTLLLVDACQSVGQLPVDVDQLGADLMCATGRKFLRAPRGTGFLYAREAVLDRLVVPSLDLRSASWTAPDAYEPRPGARRFETWEYPVPARLGFGLAVKEALALGLANIEARIVALAEQLRARLAEVPGVRVHDRGARKCGIVTFTVDRQRPGDVQAGLLSRGINVSVTEVGSTRLDLEARREPAMVRASVHVYNTEGELGALAEALRGYGGDRLL